MKMQIAAEQKEKEKRQREVTCGGVKAVLLAVEAHWPAIFTPFSSSLFFLFSFLFPLPSVMFSLSHSVSLLFFLSICASSLPLYL